MDNPSQWGIDEAFKTLETVCAGSDAAKGAMSFLRSKLDALDESKLITREQFDLELAALGEAKAAQGQFVIKQLLFEATVNQRRKCLFDNWPVHLQLEAYGLLGVTPVQMFKRVSK